MKYIDKLRKMKTVFSETIDLGGIKYGNMNTAAAYYPKKMTAEERQIDFLKRRIKLGEELGFDGYKFYMANQETKDGSYKVIDQEIVDSKKDGWLVDNVEDILIVTKDTPEIVIGHPVADCPVVIMKDIEHGVTAIGHCSGEMVDKKLPMMIADALLDAYDSKDENIIAYVSSCVSPDWTYNGFPSWAKDEKVWKDSIVSVYDSEKQQDTFKIDIRKAIKSQFEERNIKLWTMSDVNTDKDSLYFSNYASKGLGIKEKDGRNFVGAFYKKTR